MLDKCIVALYLLLTMIVGLYFSRNVRTVRNFSIANKECSTPVLIIAFLAASFGAGSTVGDIAKIASEGLIFVFSISGFLIFCLYAAKYIAPCFDNRFRGMFSAGDIVGYFYGQNASRIAAFIGFCTGAIAVGAQITAIGHICGFLFLLEYKFAIIISTTIVVIYSTLGGMRSIAITDTFKFCVLALTVPCMVYYMMHKAGGWEVFEENIAFETSLLKHPKLTEYILLFIVTLSPFLWFSPPVVQRLLMASRSSQITQIYLVEILVRVVVMLLITLMAISAIRLFPDVAPTKLVAKILEQGLSQGMRGLFIICMLSASMSSSDASLNAAVVMITHNVFKAFCKHEKQELLLMRFMTVSIGICALFIAALEIDIVEMAITASALWGAAVAVPMLFGMLRLHSSKLAFYCSVVCSFLWYTLNVSYKGAFLQGFWLPSTTVFISVAAFISGGIFCKLRLPAHARLS